MKKESSKNIENTNATMPAGEATNGATMPAGEATNGTTMPAEEATMPVETFDTVNAILINQEDEKAFEKLDGRIALAATSVESNMLVIFGSLAVIAERKLYKVSGYKDACEYLFDKHGMKISKGQLSDAVNTFKKFGDMRTGFIKSDWMAYTFSQLKLMRKLSDEDLEKVSPATTCRELQAMINAAKGIEEKSAESDNTADSDNTAESEKSVKDSEPAEKRVEDSGNVEPYIELTYTMADFVEADAETIKEAILACFKSGYNVHINFKY